MPGRPDDNLAQNARGHAQAGRASSWARSRPCVVVGAEPAVRRPAGLLDLAQNVAAAPRRAEPSEGMLEPAVPCSSRPCVVVGSELAWMGTRTVERLRDPGHNMPGSPSS